MAVGAAIFQLSVQSCLANSSPKVSRGLKVRLIDLPIPIPIVSVDTVGSFEISIFVSDDCVGPF
jgi:hypothetical protein